MCHQNIHTKTKDKICHLFLIFLQVSTKTGRKVKMNPWLRCQPGRSMGHRTFRQIFYDALNEVISEDQERKQLQLVEANMYFFVKWHICKQRGDIKRAHCFVAMFVRFWLSPKEESWWRLLEVCLHGKKQDFNCRCQLTIEKIGRKGNEPGHTRTGIFGLEGALTFLPE